MTLHGFLLLAALFSLCLEVLPGPHEGTASSPPASSSWTISLRVVDDAGRPLQGAEVGFDPLESPFSSDSAKTPRRRFLAGIDGWVRFEIDEVPRSWMDIPSSILIEKPGYLPVQRFPHELDKSKSGSVDLGTVVLSPCGVVSIVVKRSSGELVENAEVTLKSNQRDAEALSGTTDGKGAVVFPTVEPGLYDVYSHSIGLSAIVEQYRVVVGDSSVLSVLVTPHGVGQLFGSVSDETRRASSGCKVELSTPRGWTDSGRTGPSGGYYFTEVPPRGPYTLILRHGDFEPITIEKDQLSDFPMEFSVAAAARLRVGVLGAEGVMPGEQLRYGVIRMQSVTGNSVSPDWSVVTEGVECDGLQPRMLTVSIAPPKGHLFPKPQQVSLVAGATKTLSFQLEKWKPQEVLVSDQNGLPVRGAVVRLSNRKNGKVLHESLTNATGIAESRWNGGPDSVLRVNAEGYGQSAMAFSAPRSDRAQVTLGPGHTVLLTFTTADGEPVLANFGVDLVDIAVRENVIGVVMRSGNPGKFENMKAGEYQLQITRLSYTMMDFGELYKPEKTIRVESSGKTMNIVYPLEHIPALRE